MLSFTMTILLASLTVQFLHGESFCSLMLQMWSKLNMLFRWADSCCSCRRQLAYIYNVYGSWHVYGFQRKDSRPVSRVLYAALCAGVCHLSSICVATDIYRSTLRLGRVALSLYSPVYMNFQPPGCTAPMSPLAWWALTPPSHPYSDVQSGYFLLHLQTLANLFLLGSGVPFAARTFLSLRYVSGTYEPAADRPAVLFLRQRYK